jgi:prepilin-type N-terminal cleavage/methylation domain-containing protein
MSRTVRNARSQGRGFTLLEVLVSAVLLGAGIAGVLGAFSVIARGEDRTREIEKMHRLAVDKYNELRATTDQFAANDGGDLSDRGEPNYSWALSVDPTGVQNLDAITVKVERKNNSADNAPSSEITELLFQPPQQDNANGGATP